MTIMGVGSGVSGGKNGPNDRSSICAARSRMDSMLAEPKITQTVLIRPEPAFRRQPMVQLREARGRFSGPGATPLPAIEPRGPIAEFFLTEASSIDLRVESSRADHSLRLARLAGRAAIILQQIAAERAESDARVQVADAQHGPSGTLIPAQRWEPTVPSHVTSRHHADERPEPIEGDAGLGVMAVDELAATIRLLGSLRDEGLLTDAEFDAKKAEILARI